MEHRTSSVVHRDRFLEVGCVPVERSLYSMKVRKPVRASEVEHWTRVVHRGRFLEAGCAIFRILRQNMTDVRSEG